MQHIKSLPENELWSLVLHRRIETIESDKNMVGNSLQKVEAASDSANALSLLSQYHDDSEDDAPESTCTGQKDLLAHGDEFIERKVSETAVCDPDKRFEEIVNGTGGDRELLSPAMEESVADIDNEILLKIDATAERIAAVFGDLAEDVVAKVCLFFIQWIWMTWCCAVWCGVCAGGGGWR